MNLEIGSDIWIIEIFYDGYSDKTLIFAKDKNQVGPLKK
jgi:hypothetical protein